MRSLHYTIETITAYQQGVLLNKTSKENDGIITIRHIFQFQKFSEKISPVILHPFLIQFDLSYLFLKLYYYTFLLLSQYDLIVL